MTTVLTIHAFQLHRGPVWRSDAWQSPPAARHLLIVPPAASSPGQLSLFGATA